jgi:hypothetical protein
MFRFLAQDVIATLKSSPRLNPAFKQVLKKQVRGNAGAERFVKDFRELIEGVNDVRTAEFLERNEDKYAGLVVFLGTFAFAELVEKTASAIIEKHADTFNSTYAVNGEELQIKNAKEFDAILADVNKTVAASIAEAGRPGSHYLTAVLLHAVFEPVVFQEALKRIVPQVLRDPS